MYEADITVVFILQMKTQTQRSQGPCLQGHMAQSVSLLSYSSPSTSAKGLLFLHLKLSKGWHSFPGPRRGLGKTGVKILRSPWMENVWTAGGSSVLGVVVTPSPWKARSMCTVEGIDLMPDLCSLTCLPPSILLLLSQVDHLTLLGGRFPFSAMWSLRNQWGRLGKMTWSPLPRKGSI